VCPIFSNTLLHRLFLPLYFTDLSMYLLVDPTYVQSFSLCSRFFSSLNCSPQIETSEYFHPQVDSYFDRTFSVTSRRYWYKKCGANARILLPLPLQQAFANKQIVCVEYDSLGEEQEREIFQVCRNSTTFRLHLPTYDRSVSSLA
jgi:hypothetical protein